MLGRQSGPEKRWHPQSVATGFRKSEWLGIVKPKNKWTKARMKLAYVFMRPSECWENCLLYYQDIRIWKAASKSILVGPTTTTYTSSFLDARHCLLFLYHPRISPIFISFWRIIRTLSSFGEACVGECTSFSSACSFLYLWEISLVGPVSTLSDAKLFKEIPRCASAWVSHAQQRLC